jgi:hypothetical protein
MNPRFFLSNNTPHTSLNRTTRFSNVNLAKTGEYSTILSILSLPPQAWDRERIREVRGVGGEMLLAFVLE